MLLVARIRGTKNCEGTSGEERNYANKFVMMREDFIWHLPNYHRQCGRCGHIGCYKGQETGEIMAS